MGQRCGAHNHLILSPWFLLHSFFSPFILSHSQDTSEPGSKAPCCSAPPARRSACLASGNMSYATSTSVSSCRHASKLRAQRHLHLPSTTSAPTTPISVRQRCCQIRQRELQGEGGAAARGGCRCYLRWAVVLSGVAAVDSSGRQWCCHWQTVALPSAGCFATKSNQWC